MAYIGASPVPVARNIFGFFDFFSAKFPNPPLIESVSHSEICWRM